ncbi:MAG: class I SAM-dependent methyltransferase [Actinobacteria bacterium]|nr:class I SAM-dependent methyltransferase [Actinomycetota bacterium]
MSEEIMTCPSCHSSDIKRTHVYRDISFNKCKQCKLAFVFPPETGEPEEIGSSLSSPTATGYLANLYASPPERPEKALKLATNRTEKYKAALGRVPGNICEIGAGDGVFSDAYFKLGIDYFGIDVNEKLVRKARSMGRNVELAQVKDINNKYDVVFSSQVLEHILEPNEFLTSLFEILVDDGLVHFDVPNHNGLVPLMRKVVPRGGNYGFLQVPHHQVAYNKGSLAFALNNNGFKPEWIKAYSNFDPVWGQIVPDPPFMRAFVLKSAGLIGLGSLLVTFARKAV